MIDYSVCGQLVKNNVQKSKIKKKKKKEWVIIVGAADWIKKTAVI